MDATNVCQCRICQQAGDHPDKQLHHQINLLLSRLDEQQSRWFVAVEANQLGAGGARLMSQITGMDIKTIRRGQVELAANLAGRPPDRVRLPGAGRPPAARAASPVAAAALCELWVQAMAYDRVGQ
jgi:hypothetical protein